VALSARSQLSEALRPVKLGSVMAEVVVDVVGSGIVRAITAARPRPSASRRARRSPSERPPRSCWPPTEAEGRPALGEVRVSDG
jgi:hypothetical protein